MQARFDIGFSARTMTAAKRTEAAERPIQPTGAVNVAEFFGWPRKLVGGRSLAKDL